MFFDEVKLMRGDCIKRMQEIEANSIDLTVTSPPYDDLRTYNDKIEYWSEQKWRQLFQELFRVTKQGGVVVWIVGDATVNGSETGTSFKQALWAMYCGFSLHDTMIYAKNHCPFPEVNRYYPSFEYMFVFSKEKPKTFNPISDRENKHGGNRFSGTDRMKDGSTRPMSYTRTGREPIIKKKGVRFNLWYFAKQHNKEHPATFPKQLAHDHIISWSNKGDVVLDPLMGSGTTGMACMNAGRYFIGIEIDEDYFISAKKRIRSAYKSRGLLNFFNLENKT